MIKMHKNYLDNRVRVVTLETRYRRIELRRGFVGGGVRSLVIDASKCPHGLSWTLWHMIGVLKQLGYCMSPCPIDQEAAAAAYRGWTGMRCRVSAETPAPLWF